MALSRSASGPGGLSINTNSANSLFGSNTSTTGGMFGSTTASKPLFGASATTTTPQTGGLLGATTTQPSTGGLFGSATTAPATGGLFGSSTSTTQAPAAGGLFGSKPSTTQPQSGGLFGNVQPQQSSSLFGSTPASQSQQSASLFGSTPASQPQQSNTLFSGLGQQNQSAGGGLFGASSTAPAAQSGSLFGTSNTQNQTKPAGSLFGGLGSNQQQQQSQPQQSNMFGANQNQTQGTFLGSSLGGGLSLGQSMNTQQTVPGVRIDTTNIRGTTRFNDLHEDLQKEISNIDTVIQAQIQLKNDCDAIMPSHDSQLNQVPVDVTFCHRKLVGLQHAASSDAQSIDVLKKYSDTDIQNASLSVSAIHNLRLPYQYHTSGIWNTKAGSADNRAQQSSETEDIVGYFSRTTEELASTLSTYQKHMTEIEQHLRGVEANSVQQVNAMAARQHGSTTDEEDQRLQLGNVFNDVQQSILNVAEKVGYCKDGVQQLQLDGFGGSQGRQMNGKKRGVY